MLYNDADNITPLHGSYTNARTLLNDALAHLPPNATNAIVFAFDENGKLVAFTYAATAAQLAWAGARLTFMAGSLRTPDD